MTSTRQQPLLLSAFAGKTERVPVWFMRQAGRYLPQYQALKSRYSLDELFENTELIIEITKMPVDVLDVDAAIVFADILTLIKRCGIDVRFDRHRGPVIDPSFSRDPDVKHLQPLEEPDYLLKALAALRSELPEEKALIGFAGGPFSVLTYLIEKGVSSQYRNTFRLMYENPKTYHAIMKFLTEQTIHYLDMQRRAGVDVFQLFDTHAGVLRASDYAAYVQPYVRRIFEETDLPSIYFVRNTDHLLALLDLLPCDFLSVDQTVILGHHFVMKKTKKGIQGNLFNGLLYADEKTLRKEVRDVLAGGTRHERYIFNLSHGVHPDTEVDKLRLVIDEVRKYPLTT